MDLLENLKAYLKAYAIDIIQKAICTGIAVGIWLVLLFQIIKVVS